MALRGGLQALTRWFQGEWTAMRTTINVDADLLAAAERLTGVRDRGTLVREALNALIERESGRRLARLGGSELRTAAPPRNRATPPR